MLRRSAIVVATDSGFLLELFRDSHAKGLVSFLDVGGGGAAFSCTAGGWGGGGNLTGDILPDRPWSALLVESRESRGGNFGSVVEFLALSPSSDTSSMSDVTDIRCAVRRGDLADNASSLACSFAVSSLTCRGTSGTSGGGDSSLLSWAEEVDESRLLRRDRDRDRSDCESGRGVISEASSKSSTPLSELCELVGLSLLSAMIEAAGANRLGYGEGKSGSLKGRCSRRGMPKRKEQVGRQQADATGADVVLRMCQSSVHRARAVVDAGR